MKRNIALIIASFIAALCFILAYFYYGHASNLILGFAWICIGSAYVYESRKKS